MADKEYYATLQKLLESYDCVLYEMMVSRKNLERLRDPAAAKKIKVSWSRLLNNYSCHQRLKARLLKLDCQFQCLDYRPENWYHADLDSKTIKATPDRYSSMVQPPSNSEELGPWRFRLKVFSAKHLASESTLDTAEVDKNSVFVGERNRVATEALGRAIDDGHNKIDILYGTMHMPDLGRRLREEFDLIPLRVQWMTAWLIRNWYQNSSFRPF